MGQVTKADEKETKVEDVKIVVEKQDTVLASTGGGDAAPAPA